MSKELNFKAYLISVLIICIIVCFFSFKAAIGIILGTAYFFISDILNQYKFAKFDSKGNVIMKVFMFSFVQFVLILGVALASYFIGGLSCFLASFAGITVPHIYFIICELKKKAK